MEIAKVLLTAISFTVRIVCIPADFGWDKFSYITGLTGLDSKRFDS